MALSESVRREIEILIGGHPVVLFLKGTRARPACGFSAQVVQILDELLPVYETVDVLTSPEIREGIKEYSEWPTIPQLYVSGKFIGGCDIIKEMDAAGELAPALGVVAEKASPPAVHFSEAAIEAFSEAAAEAGDDVLRLEVSPRFEYQLFFGPKEKADFIVQAGRLSLHVDPRSARRADGATIDFLTGPQGDGFKIDNPNEPGQVRQLGPVELKKLLDAQRPLVLLDVRTEQEIAIARIPGAIAYADVNLSALERGATIVCQCHHGVRSQTAAEQLVRQGFRNVYNLRGGIDAWSTEVDAAVARY
jgi:monothiol glutaredoxin